MPATHRKFQPSVRRHGRNRRPISCFPCRHRKLKCDRGRPACGNCVNRGNITACSYVADSMLQADLQQTPDSSEPVQTKVDRLERLVLTLLKNQQQTQERIKSPPGWCDTDIARDSNGADVDSQEHCRSTQREDIRIPSKSDHSIAITADYKQSLSVDEAHWALLFNEIGQVRSYIHAQQTRYEEQNKKIAQILQRPAESPAPTLLFGSTRNMSRSEIIAQLPSRYSCDLVLSRFFSHLYPAIHILHKPTFYRQYERFWIDKDETSTAWCAMLFAMLRIAMLDYLRERDEPQEYEGKCQDMATNFRNCFTDCVIIADYTLPQNFLIEALILHLYAEYVTSRDARSGTWVLVGMVARLAMRMGYHQPLQPTLTSTPFQAEMRRRAWAFIRQADILLSFQVGLPSMIGVRSSEMHLPRNIYDSGEFHEKCSTLPPALPDTEATQISFLIAKTKLAFGFARALEEINWFSTIRWERVLEIDRELRDIYDKIPDHYKIGHLSGQDSLVLVSARFVLASIHHKSLCAVHSRFLQAAKSDNRLEYSRRVCLDSAMTILRFQAIQNQDIPVDGRLRSLTNYQTSLAIHDYLLAATIIAAELSSNTVKSGATHQQNPPGVWTRTAMIKALSLSARIFGQMGDYSMEAYKAADILGMLVTRFTTEDQDDVQNSKDRRRGDRDTLESDQDAFTLSSQDKLDSSRGNPRSYREAQTLSMGVSDLSSNPTDLDIQSIWPAYQTRRFDQLPLDLSPLFSGFEASVGAEFAENLRQSMTEDSASDGTADFMVYPDLSVLNDPMSTLWNLNQG